MPKQERIGLGAAARGGTDVEDGPFLRVTQGSDFLGKYDVDTRDIIFWRGDTRPPDQVFATGLSSRYVRDHNEREIVWRCGVDDIVPASAVCLARDIRGAAFFPYPDLNSLVVEDTNYLYAMTVPRASCTYAIQKVAESAEQEPDEVDEEAWRRAERFGYDPAWDNKENASCVWQFGEYAVHEVPGNRILAGWKCTRMMLVREKNDERVQAGIRFRLHNEVVNPNALFPLKVQEARTIARRFHTEYPRRYGQFLSYFGLVEARLMPCESVSAAGRLARQLQALVTASDADWCTREDGAGMEGTSEGVRLSSPSGLPTRTRCHF